MSVEQAWASLGYDVAGQAAAAVSPSLRARISRHADAYRQHAGRVYATLPANSLVDMLLGSYGGEVLHKSLLREVVKAILKDPAGVTNNFHRLSDAKIEEIATFLNTDILQWAAARSLWPVTELYPNWAYDWFHAQMYMMKIGMMVPDINSELAEPGANVERVMSSSFKALLNSEDLTRVSDIVGDSGFVWAARGTKRGCVAMIPLAGYRTGGYPSSLRALGYLTILLKQGPLTETALFAAFHGLSPYYANLRLASPASKSLIMCSDNELADAARRAKEVVFGLQRALLIKRGAETEFIDTISLTLGLSEYADDRDLFKVAGAALTLINASLAARALITVEGADVGALSYKDMLKTLTDAKMYSAIYNVKTVDRAYTLAQDLNRNRWHIPVEVKNMLRSELTAKIDQYKRRKDKPPIYDALVALRDAVKSA